MSLQEKIIDYQQHKEDIEHWTLLKGDFRYERIISFMEGKGIACTWSNITNYIKYDKRILINSFRYLTFLEEFYKSILNRETNIPVGNIIRMEFRDTLEEYLKLENMINYDEMALDILASKKEAIIEFRNSVCHNKILLDRKFDGETLVQLLNVLLKVLPKSSRKGFAHDINGCSKGLVESLYHIQLEYNESN